MKQMAAVTMMTVFFLLFSSLSFVSFADETADNILQGAEVCSADQAAVEALGEKRGAMELFADIRNIEGIVSGMDGTVVDLNQTINDLGGKVEGNLLFIELSSDILFDFDKADIKSAAAETLRKVALIIKKKAEGPVSIIGYTDSKGSSEYNQKLSLRRAKATKKWLIEKGGAKAKYRVEGRGESDPVAENTRPDGSDNPEGRAKNRRVDVIVQVAE